MKMFLSFPIADQQSKSCVYGVSSNLKAVVYEKDWPFVIVCMASYSTCPESLDKETTTEEGINMKTAF